MAKIPMAAPAEMAGDRCRAAGGPGLRRSAADRDADVPFAAPEADFHAAPRRFADGEGLLLVSVWRDGERCGAGGQGSAGGGDQAAEDPQNQVGAGAIAVWSRAAGDSQAGSGKTIDPSARHR